MQKRENETQLTRVSRLVRTAFHLAGTGEEIAAKSYWKSAINSGYVPTEKNIKGFEIAIAKGKRETRT